MNPQRLPARFLVAVVAVAGGMAGGFYTRDGDTMSVSLVIAGSLIVALFGRVYARKAEEVEKLVAEAERLKQREADRLERVAERESVEMSWRSQ